MNTHVVPVENAAKVVQALFAIHPVVVIVASVSEGEFVIRGFFDRTRTRRCELTMSNGRPEPVEAVEGGIVVQVAGPDMSWHGAVTGHARAMATTSMAEAERLIMHVDPTLVTRSPSGAAGIEGVAVVVVS